MAAKESDKEKNLEMAMSQIERQFGKGAIMRLGTRETLAMETVPTGSLAVDAALGVGGFPRGRVVEVYGPESSGKTTLALSVIAQGQKRGGVCAFIDAEHALDPEYSKKLGVDIDNLLVSQPDTGEQALEIAELLIRSGALDVVAVDSVAALTPKAEIEGEIEVGGPVLAQSLGALGLIDASEAEERHRNVTVTPFWREDDGTGELAGALYAALKDGPDLPGKFGFALDTGPRRVLAGTSADIRIERAASGGLMLRADGAGGGQAVSAEQAVPLAMEMARWFLSSGGAEGGRGRMAPHVAHQPTPFATDCQPATYGAGARTRAGAVTWRAGGAGIRADPGRTLRGTGLGSAAHHPLADAADRSCRDNVPDHPGLIADSADPRLRVMACTGKPESPQALQETLDRITAETGLKVYNLPKQQEFYVGLHFHV